MSRSLLVLVLLPLTVGVVHLLALVLPFGWEAGAALDVPTPHPGRYGGTAAFHLRARGTGRDERMRFTSAYVVYSGVETPGELDVDLEAMTYRLGLYGYEHLPPRPLTREAVLDYVSRGGFEPATVEGAETAEALFKELHNLSVGVLPPQVKGQAAYVQRPMRTYSLAGKSYVNLGEYGHLFWLPWYWPACLLIWGLVAAVTLLPVGRRQNPPASPPECVP